jgi:hypothetical protein
MWGRQRATIQPVERSLTAEVAPVRGVLVEVMAMIDQGLETTTNRQLVTSEEVCDLLLDLRVALTDGEVEPADRARSTAA